MTVTLTVDRVRVSASAAQYVLAISARIMVSRGRGCLSLSIAVCAFGYTHRALTERLRALSLDTTVDTPHAARRVGTASIQLYGRTCYYEIRVGLGGYVELVISSLQLPRNGFITILATQLYSSTAGARVPAQQP